MSNLKIVLMAIGLAVGMAACDSIEETEPPSGDAEVGSQALQRPGLSPPRGNLPTQSCDNPSQCRFLEYACGQTPGHDFRCYKRDSQGGCIDGLCRQPVCLICDGGFGRL